MQKAKNILITIIFLFLGKLSSLLSIKQRLALGKIVGKVLISLSKKRKDITLDNLRKAFQDKSEEELVQIMQGAYYNLGIVLLEVLILNRINKENLSQYITYKNPELITELAAKGKGIILLSGHYGNWELLAYSAGLITDIPLTIIVKHQKNAYSDKILNEYRTSQGNQVVDMANAAREIVSKLKNGDVIALLADQAVFGTAGELVSFFGRKTDVYATPAKLALKFKTPIVMGFAQRLESGKYEVELMEIEHNDLKDDAYGLSQLSQRHVSALECYIRQKPELWAWQHRRWKNADKL